MNCLLSASPTYLCARQSMFLRSRNPVVRLEEVGNEHTHTTVIAYTLVPLLPVTLVNAVKPSSRSDELKLINRPKNRSASLEVRMKLGQSRSVPRLSSLPAPAA